MSDLTYEAAVENVFTSIRADNEEIDKHIAALKAAMAREGRKDATFDPTKLVQNNRSGRKLMQAYFRQRGVTVKFEG